MMGDDAIRCRCMGVDRRTRCQRDATEEDGYCDHCRCPHGGCDQHGDVPNFWDTDPLVWMEAFSEAMGIATNCMIMEGRSDAEELGEEDDGS